MRARYYGTKTRKTKGSMRIYVSLIYVYIFHFLCEICCLNLTMFKAKKYGNKLINVYFIWNLVVLIKNGMCTSTSLYFQITLASYTNDNYFSYQFFFFQHIKCMCMNIIVQESNLIISY